MAVRLIDIAKKVGVSIQAVAAVVNNAKGTAAVSAETRRRIEAVAKELGYVPNAGARAIKRGRFNRIAFVATRFINAEDYSAPSPTYLQAAATSLAEKGYSLVYEPLDIDVKTFDFIEPPRLFTELAVDGILALFSAGHVPKVDENLQAMHAPLVWINRNPDDRHATIICDEAAGATMLIEHLVSLGHHRIAYIGLDGVHYSAKDRHHGILLAMQRAGLDTSHVLMLPGTRSPAPRTLEVIDTFAPTALICYNHLFYETVLLALASRGLRVPADISLCYFACPHDCDNFLKTTLIQIPEGQMALTAADLLLERIHQHCGTPTVKAIPGKLQVGTTTAVPR